MVVVSRHSEPMIGPPPDRQGVANLPANGFLPVAHSKRLPPLLNVVPKFLDAW